MVATYDEKDIKIYADGELLDSNGVSKPLIEDDASLWIGYDGDFNGASNDRYFPGIIDELRIYNKVLSKNEIRQNLNAKGLAVQNSSEKLAITWGEIKVSR